MNHSLLKKLVRKLFGYGKCDLGWYGGIDAQNFVKSLKEMLDYGEHILLVPLLLLFPSCRCKGLLL